MLSGKYLQGVRPPGARLTLYDRFTRYTGNLAQWATQSYVELAHKYKLEPTQMALAYVNSRSFLTSNIIAGTSLAQLESNIKSIDLELSAEVIAGIEAIHIQSPNPAP